MGWLEDIFEFEKENLKYMWDGIKDDPERLLIGAIEPFSTELWNTVLDKDYEPLVDQMGGAYGGDWISVADPDGGVYGIAKDKGIDTEAGGGMHDIAHVVAAAIAGNYGMGQIPGGEYANMGGGKGGNKQPPQADFKKSEPVFDIETIEEKRRKRELAEMLRKENEGKTVRSFF